MQILPAIVLFLCLGFSLVAGEEGEGTVRWTRPGPIPSAPGTKGTARGARLQVEVGEVVAITDVVNVLRENGDGVYEEKKLQVGDKVFVNDRINVGVSSSIEITLGINARLRVGPGSSMRIVDRTDIPTSDNKGVMTKRDVELTSGSARVRVRKNEISASPILLISGDVQIMLQRSDAVIERSREESENTVMILRGKADVKMKTKGQGGWEESEIKSVEAEKKPQKIVIPDGSLKSLPEATEVSDKEFDAVRNKLAFTIDEKLKRRPPPREKDDELDGP
ncbi:MAG: FecR domain-containing protein [Planctomycetes bacterium]|nr:FecR domain-containing protein [Planctomycetota bacterium]